MDFQKRSILHNLSKLKQDLQELGQKKDFKEGQVSSFITGNYESNLNKFMILLTEGFKPKPNLSSTLTSIYEELNLFNYDNNTDYKPVLTYQISDGLITYYLANSFSTLEVGILLI